MAFDPDDRPAGVSEAPGSPGADAPGAGDAGARVASPSDAAGEPVDGANDETAPRAASDGDAPQPPEAEAADGAPPTPNAAEPSGVEPDATPPAASADGELSEAEPADPALAALEQRAAKAEEYLALAQRTKADFENYRKRAIREAALAQERGVAKLAKELLPAVDNLDRALTAAQTAADAAGEGDEVHAQLLSGIQLVHADVISALQRAGIEAFSPEGEAFDPQWHEAVAQAPVPDAQSGCVVEVYQRGYRLGESVLRPARVLVAA